MEKNNIAIIVLAVALVASGVGNIILAVRITPQPTYNTLVRGTGAGPHTIDPVNCWDSASSDVILQVAEGLFGYDLTDWSMPRVNVLASGYYWQDTTHLQVTLRQGVMFHDGAVWNSTSAIWNFDRIMLLTNSSGDLPLTSPLAEPASLYFFNMTFNEDGIMTGGVPIINSVTAVGAWNITFVLNAPFAPFLDLLCFEASLMVSPKSTPADRFLTLSEKLVGTGPFTFDSYTPNVDVRYSRFEHYWRPAAGFEKMVFSIIQDPVTLNNAMLGGQLDLISGIIPSLVPTYEADPNVFVWHITDDLGITGLSYYYLGFNNVLINQTMRKAISYAINYSYIIEQMSHNLVFRANSPIAPGYGSAYNASVQAADFNLGAARQVLIDAGVVPGGMPVTNNSETEWTSLTIGSYNYSYNTDNSFRSDLYLPLKGWLEQIGVKVIDNGGTWDDFLTKLYVNHNQLGLYWVGWGPDYLDPFNMLDPLFNPASSSDSAQVDDAYLNSQLELALKTTDQTARDNIYKHIQYYLANVLYPHAFGYHPKLTAIHGSDIYGYNYNAMGKFQAYGIYRGPPRPVA
jgi:ABC-type transport system substrate-binding protein